MNFKFSLLCLIVDMRRLCFMKYESNVCVNRVSHFWHLYGLMQLVFCSCKWSNFVAHCDFLSEWELYCDQSTLQYCSFEHSWFLLSIMFASSRSSVCCQSGSNRVSTELFTLCQTAHRGHLTILCF